MRIIFIIMIGALFFTEQIACKENELSCNQERNLFRAIRRGKLRDVQQLIKKGVQLNTSDSCNLTPLMWAAHEGYAQIACSLLEGGAWLDAQNYRGTTALMFAATQAKRDVVEVLLSRRANVNIQDQQGNTAFMQVPCIILEPKPAADLARLILNPAYKADLSLKNCDGNTMLILATAAGNHYMVQCILTTLSITHHHNKLARQAIINHHNNDGLNALHVAMNNWYNDIAELLIACGINVDLANNCGITPLMITAQKNNKRMLRLLVDNHANINASDNNGYTPLMFAAQRGDEVMVSYLLDHGADASLQTKHGTIAQDLAKQYGFTDVVKLLTCPTNGKPEAPFFPFL